MKKGYPFFVVLASFMKIGGNNMKDHLMKKGIASIKHSLYLVAALMGALLAMPPLTFTKEGCRVVPHGCHELSRAAGGII
jgi:hypothetical protein